ncbi:MAG: ABC transporter substrate-binding protein [Deltaproteobacteria bacterium]|nr:ABC transporter substrate-binding protein [Deltaproteobacteria bacterium]
MEKMLRRAVIFSLAVLMLAAWAAPSAAGEPVVDEWKIPFLATLTGPFAGWVSQITFGADDTVAQINAEGGIAGRPVVLEYHDDAMDPSKAVAEMSTVIKDNLLIFGPVIDAPQQAVMPMVKREGAFTFAITAGPHVVAKYKPHVITLWGEFEVALKSSLAGWLKANPDIKSVVIILSKLDAYFIYFQPLYRQYLEELGVTVLKDVEISESVNMGSVVVKAMAQKPDGYCIIDAPIGGAKVVQELDKRGLKEKRKLFLYCAMDDPGFFEIVKDSAEGAYFWNIVNRKSTNPKWVGFEKRFKEAFPGMTPGMATIPPQNMVYLAKAAVETQGLTGDPAKLAEERQMLMDYIGNIKDFPGVTGNFDMVDYQLRAPAYLFKIEGGDVVVVDTFERP